jgi:dimethylaniline monooxygenase (N-oxide forming)
MPRRFTNKGVVEFVDNGRPEYHRVRNQQIRPDMVVLCTGYEQRFMFFNNAGSHQPYPTPKTADVRNIWKRDEPSVGFIGFVRPSLGAIPPLAEMQAQLWVVNLLARHKLPAPLQPKDQRQYQLRSGPSARINYGVDHESYVYQLALDMDSAPGLSKVLKLRSLKLLITWAFGANFNTKFRLQGPWKWEGAAALLVSDEFWGTITRRPILFGKY